MATFIKAGFWEQLCKPCRGYKGWLNLDELIKSLAPPAPTPTYKVYTALLTQTDQDPPVATILQNTLGFTPTWEYVSSGQYRLVSPTSGGFPTNKTFITISQVTSSLSQSGDGLTDLHALIETTSRILLYDKNAAGDGEMYDTPIEIRVYP